MPMLRTRLNPPEEFFPVDPWALKSRRFGADYVPQAETAFALANGYLGLRASNLEDRPVQEPGTYLNGFYELRPIVYGEIAFGFPRFGQTMLNCPDGKIIKLYIDDEPFRLDKATILAFKRRLDMQAGTLLQDVTFCTPAGKQIRQRSTRLVSFKHRHLALIHYQLVALDADAEFIVTSELVDRQPLPVATNDPRMGEGFAGRVLHPTGQAGDELRAVLSFVTQGSKLALGCGMEHSLETTCPVETTVERSDDHAAVTFKISAQQGAPIRITKYLSYHYSDGGDSSEIRAQTGWTLDRAEKEGVDKAIADQAAIVGAFWERSDVLVDCPSQPRQQQLVRWNLFQLLQASGRAEGHGIGARGLTGRTYEGHYFWDTEIYVLPFLIYTHRERARSILGHRYHQLGKARARAAELGHQGATFPWRTINGDEASAYYAAGTAQYHINADIAYAVRQYVEVTGDTDFLHRYGAEILVETARFWLDLGFVSDRDGKFHIHGVTGPDEYTAVVDNNYFTNLMAQENLTFAADVADRLEQHEPEVFRRLQQAIALAPNEAAAWRDAGERMYLPTDEHTDIHPQDADFLSKRPWDLANTPPDHFPLLLHYHPLNLYRHQVIKQADVLLAMFLISDHFSTEEMKRNFDYYDPLTTHDSSLSVCIQSIIAAEIGYMDKAKEYFDFALSMDLGDVGGNMMQGAHIASIGGTWLALVYGFGGMRDRGGDISFRPRLPEEWRRLRFPLTVRGNRFTVDITAEATTYTLETGDGLSITHRGETLNLSPAAPTVSRA